MPVQHKWRIAIIMSHDGETYFEYNDLEQSILNQGKFENLSYMIFYHNQRYKKNSIKEVFRGDKIRYLQDRPETEYFQDLDFYNKDTLIEFLKLVSSQPLEPDTEYHYMVMTWGHGGGLYYYNLEVIKKMLEEFGLFEKNNKADFNLFQNISQESVVRYAALKANFSSKSDPGFSNGIFPFLTPDIFTNNKKLINTRLTATELKEKIKEVNNFIEGTLFLYAADELNEIFKAGLPVKVEVYFALNCYTQMLETGFELEESVEMMIAPQTIMPLPGINYFELFKALEANPGLSRKQIADNITRNFNCKYKNEAFERSFNNRYLDFDLGSVSFSCNYLSEYGNLINTINEMTMYFIKIYNRGRGSNDFNAVMEARKKCNDITLFDGFGIIDLTSFLDHLKETPPPSLAVEFSQLVDTFHATKSRAMVSIKAPEIIYTSPEGASENPQFLSFFAPALASSNNITFLLDRYTNRKTRFSNRSIWDNFLPTFYRDTF